MENVILVIILLPVKYLLKLSGSRNFYRLRMTSLTSTNVFTISLLLLFIIIIQFICLSISCLSIEPNPPPPPRFGKFISIARCKALQSLYCTIRRLFVLFVDYSRTIRTIRRLFADYSYYSSTFRGLFALFVDYSHYSHCSLHYSSFINCRKYIDSIQYCSSSLYFVFYFICHVS